MQQPGKQMRLSAARFLHDPITYVGSSSGWGRRPLPRWLVDSRHHSGQSDAACQIAQLL